MKASELRIGNLVYVGYSGTIECILGVIDENAKLTFLGSTYHGLLFKYPEPVGNKVIELNSCEPIPLTEDWLVKFWFEKKVNNGHRYDPFYWSNAQIDLHQTLEGDLFIGCSENEYYDCVPYNDHQIKYVHQLQNLYFALTGQELTIKEPAV